MKAMKYNLAFHSSPFKKNKEKENFPVSSFLLHFLEVCRWHDLHGMLKKLKQRVLWESASLLDGC